MNKKIIELLLEPINNIPIYANVFEQNIASETHNHKYVELVAVIKGSATHLMNNQRVELKYGDVFVVKVGAEHQYVDYSSDFTVINLAFMPQNLLIWHLDLPSLSGYENILLGAYNELNEYPLLHFKEDKFQEILVLLNAIINAGEQRHNGSQFYIFSLFMTLIYHLTMEYSKQSKPASADDYKTTKAIEYINRHYQQEISIETLCKVSQMSRASLMRKFKHSTGFTPIQYQIEFRISKGCELLFSHDMNIAEIAFALGFKDQNYFCRQFKKITGLTPQNYRKKTLLISF